MNAVLSYTVTFGDLLVSDTGVLYMQNWEIKKAERLFGYSDNSFTLSLSLSGLRASIYERLFNYQRVSRNFRSGKSCLFTRQPYDRYHYVFAACFRQRWEYRALSGGMRYMDLPCPYAAEMIYTPHRTAAKPWQRPDKRVSAWGSQAAFYLSSRTISLSQMTKGNSFTLAWREIALLRIKHKVAI